MIEERIAAIEAVDAEWVVRLEVPILGTGRSRVYWEPALKSLTGRDLPVQEFLEASPAVASLIDDIVRFLEARIPEFERTNRGYLTVAIGCTGGQHRSVYLVERLAARFAGLRSQVLTRHTALP